MSHTDHVQGAQTTNTVSEAEAPPEATGSDGLLPAPGEWACDPLAMLGELLIEMRVEDRGRARLENHAEEQRVRHEGALQVDAIRDRGDAQLWQGMAAGVGQFGGGALSFTGGITYDGSASHLQEWQGLADATEAAGKVGEAYAGTFATGAEMRLTASETAQGTAERRANEATAEMQDALDGMRGLLAALQRIYDQELAAQKAAVFIA